MFTYFCNIASDKMHSLHLAKPKIQNMVRFLNPLTCNRPIYQPGAFGRLRQINKLRSQRIKGLSSSWMFMVTHARQEQNICFMYKKNNNLTKEEKAKKY